jgi:DNA-binding NarL/FixJ family response regulator
MAAARAAMPRSAMNFQGGRAHDATAPGAMPPPGGLRAHRPVHRLRVAIADDHAVVRSGYRRLLELDARVEIVAEFSDGESAYRWLASNEADVLILDLSMPGCGGLAALDRLRQRVPGLRILVFTMHESADLAEQTLRLGAAGYVTKSSPPESLVDAVRAVAGGKRPISPDIARALAGRSRRLDAPHASLSPREFEIFLLLAGGESVEEIAAHRSLSVKTISNYQTAVRQKTGLGSSLEMYRYAEAHGLLSDRSGPLPG